VTAEPTAKVPARKRWSGRLVAGLGLALVSLLPFSPFGPLGPLAAGVLAMLGYRAVRARPGELRGPRFAAVVMTLALAGMVLQGWGMIRNRTVAAAWTEIRRHVAAVQATLESGTAESGWELLSEDARRDLDRAAWVTRLRRAMGKLGPLVRLGDSLESGGAWDRTEEFGRTERIDLALPLRFEATFARGRGEVRLRLLVRRDGRRVSGELLELEVEPTPP